MTIYSSTTLAELLDQLDLRAPDLAAPIRERVEDLEDAMEAALDDQCPEVCDECQDLKAQTEQLDAELTDSREQCAKLIAAQESDA